MYIFHSRDIIDLSILNDAGENEMTQLQKAQNAQRLAAMDQALKEFLKTNSVKVVEQVKAPKRVTAQ